MGSYKIKDLPHYFKEYKKSVRHPEKFWNRIAKDNFQWEKPWDYIFKFKWEDAKFEWFKGAKLNITLNCIDRHLEKHGDSIAIIFEPNDPSEETQSITYSELHERVCKMANVLLEKGIQKGDCVCIYLPMIPELAIAILACARIGAIHSVVFAGFSSNAVATRINDSGSKMVIT